MQDRRRVILIWVPADAFAQVRAGTTTVWTRENRRVADRRVRLPTPCQCPVQVRRQAPQPRTIGARRTRGSRPQKSRGSPCPSTRPACPHRPSSSPSARSLLALGGTAYAALPKHSVGPAQPEEERRHVQGRQGPLAESQGHQVRSASAPRSYLKDPGSDSVDVTAVLGSPDTVIASMALPAGTFYVRSTGYANNTHVALLAELRCYLRSSGDVVATGVHGLYLAIEPHAGTNASRGLYSLDSAVELEQPGTVRVECNKGAAAQAIETAASISAVTTRKVHDVPVVTGRVAEAPCRARARTRRWCRARRARSPSGRPMPPPAGVRGRARAAGPGRRRGPRPARWPPWSRTETVRAVSRVARSSERPPACTIALVTSSERQSSAVAAMSSGTSARWRNSRRKRRAVAAARGSSSSTNRAVSVPSSVGAGSSSCRSWLPTRIRRTASAARRAVASSSPRCASSKAHSSSRKTIRPPIGEPMPGSGTAARARTSAGWPATKSSYRGSSESRSPSTGSPVRTTDVSGTSS